MAGDGRTGWLDPEVILVVAQRKLELLEALAIGQLYSTYARAADEKRYDLLAQVFTDDAPLDYRVGPHNFTCTGQQSGAAFKAFLDRCYWTNHLIAQPMVGASSSGEIKATARVVATHLQKRSADGEVSRWILRGAYHDTVIEVADGWRISKRLCVCTDSQGEFIEDGVEIFETVAWVDPAEIA